jgi:hypothetical protein
MTTGVAMTIKAHFDGKTIVPDEPVDLPVNSPLQISVEINGVSFVDPPDGAPPTVGELRKAGLMGAWKDRTDIVDSIAFAGDLRRRAELRGSAE